MEKLQTNVDVTAAYGVLVEYVNSKQKALPATFLTRAIIPQGQRSVKHTHFEKELFVILAGSGQIHSPGLSLNIQKGDLVSVNAFSDHEIVNTAQGDLEILSLTSTQKDRPELPASMLITTAPPTPNGPLHLGHAAGPYLGADLLAKYLKKRNVRTRSVFYTDDHQNYVLAKADSLNRDVDDVAKQYRKEIIDGLTSLDALAENLLDVKNNTYYKLKVQLLFEKLLQKKVIYLEEATLPYCIHCQEVLVDAYLTGNCPSCEQTSAGSCEGCGHYHTPDKILEPHCSRCKVKAHTRSVTIARLALEASRSFIEAHVEKTHMNAKLRERLKAILGSKLPNLIVSHPGNYGISTQHPQLLGQVFHVWFEMAAGLDFIRQQQPLSEWAHFFGFDNAFFYSIAIPAILELYHPHYPHATHLYANEFLELDAKKFSTSRGHALWVSEEVERFGKDFIRMALHYQSPQNSRNSISVDLLVNEKEKISSQFERMLNLAELVTDKYTDASEVKLSQLNNEEKDFFINVHLRVREAEESLHPLYFNRRATVRALLRLMLEIEDFKKDFQRSTHGLSLLRCALKAVGQLASLLAPDFSRQLGEKITLNDNWQRDF